MGKRRLSLQAQDVRPRDLRRAVSEEPLHMQRSTFPGSVKLLEEPGGSWVLVPANAENLEHQRQKRRRLLSSALPTASWYSKRKR